MIEVLPANPGQNLLNLIQREYPGYHPLVAIARLAHSDNAATDYKFAFDCHKTLAEYVEPKLKSIEVKHSVQEARRVIVSLFDDSPQDAITDGELIQLVEREEELIARD